MTRSLAEEDAREERRRQRELSRGIDIDDDFKVMTMPANPMFTPAPAAAPSTAPVPPAKPKSPAAMPQKSGVTLGEPTPFELVGELPTAGWRGPTIPVIRQQLIDFAKQHPGQWVKYLPSKSDPFTTPNSIADQARKGNGGFGPGFNASVRSKIVYVCYVGEETK